MRKVGVIGYPFIAIGIAFIAIGISSRRAFMAIGVAFLVLGFIMLTRGQTQA